jgi:hypothetical protein
MEHPHGTRIASSLGGLRCANGAWRHHPDASTGKLKHFVLGPCKFRFDAHLEIVGGMDAIIGSMEAHIGD